MVIHRLKADNNVGKLDKEMEETEWVIHRLKADNNVGKEVEETIQFGGRGSDVF